MTWFQITAHLDGTCRGLTQKGQRMANGTEMIDFERGFAQKFGTELIVMHEFRVPMEFVGLDDELSVRLVWEQAKRMADLFWMGYDAPRSVP